MEIEQHKRYRATVRLRRGKGWKVKSGSELVDGTEGEFIAGWYITDEDTPIYVGEWAMMPWKCDEWPIGVPWVASGDLENLREAKKTSLG